MQTVGQIIRQRRESLGLTLEALAQQVGLTKGYLSMIENHRVANPPTARHLQAMEQALGIGDGELQRAADWQNTPAKVRDDYTKVVQSYQRAQELLRRLRESTARRKDGARNLDKLYRSGQLTRWLNEVMGESSDGGGVDTRVPVRFQVPIINRVAAGYPSDFTDLDYPVRVADDYLACPDLSDAQAFAARVVGDSMLPQYKEGDIVVFSPAAKVADGSDCFVRLEPDHQTTFKRIFYEGTDGKHIRLQPLNPQFAPTVVACKDISGLYRAVWKFEKL